ncbi:hypothetical protein J6590_006829 [Homalodisca vitripennis]|nr:hypothetical protein J6590_006829 [Homalodisca vitripennis]
MHCMRHGEKSRYRRVDVVSLMLAQKFSMHCMRHGEKSRYRRVDVVSLMLARMFSMHCMRHGETPRYRRGFIDVSSEIFYALYATRINTCSRPSLCDCGKAKIAPRARQQRQPQTAQITDETAQCRRHTAARP